MESGAFLPTRLSERRSAEQSRIIYATANQRTVNNVNEITPHWVQGIIDSKGNYPYALGGRANTGSSPLNANSGGASIINAYP